METRSAHEVAIDWALARGYNMSVRDYSCDEWDLVHSYDRDEILEACRATDLPNVTIFNPMVTNMRKKGIKHVVLLTFSVIDEGNPQETINDYTIPADDADEWRREAFQAFERATNYTLWEKPLTEYRVRVDYSSLMEAKVMATSVEDAERQADELTFADLYPVSNGTDLEVIEVVAI